MHRRAWAVLLCVTAPMSVACTTPTAGNESEPVTAAPAVAEPAAPRATEVKPAEEPTPVPATAAPIAGRWTSEAICLQLFDNGDFELSIMDPDAPKVMVIGQAKLGEPTDRTVEADLAVERIWRARWVGPCRRTHETGRWSESEAALGRTFTPGKTVKLRITPRGDDAIELCGESCITLTRATPELVARWRIAGLESPDRPAVTWAPGDLLEIRIDGDSSHVWAGGAGKAFVDVPGSTSVSSTGPDTFDLTFTPRPIEGADTAALLGGALKAGDTRTLTATRRPNERLEVCAGTACATLERQFDAHHYDLD